MDLKDLKPGEGNIVNYKGQQAAVYKDESGKIYIVSEKCTYEGCDLFWNGEEKVWQCPCCGSKYSIEGKVVHGPATMDLTKINV